MLTLFHDYTDPASAVAVRRVQRIADEGLPVTFAGFEAVGVEATLPVPLGVLANLDALRDVARDEGVELRRPPSLPPTGRAHVMGEAAERAGLGASWRQVCYGAYWHDGADIGEQAVLVDLAVQAGLARAAAVATAGDDIALLTFRRTVGAHRRAGVGGVPVVRAHQTLVPGLLPEGDLRDLASL